MYPNPHMLLAWSGEFMAGDTTFTAVDQFAGSLRFDGAGVLTMQRAEVLDGLVTALTAFWKRGDSFIPNRARLRTIKWNLVNGDGRYANKTATLERRDLDVAGTASMIHPLQVSWCATWLADQKRGLATRGRTYFPTGVEISSSQFTVTETNCRTFQRSLTQLIRDLNAVTSTDQDHQVRASIVSNQREGATHPITVVGVGDRLDIQRRRAESQPEARYTGPVVVAP